MGSMYEFIRLYMEEYECSYQEAFRAWDDAVADMRMQQMREGEIEND